MWGCYCDGGSSSKIEARIVQPLALPSAPIRRGLAVSLVVHVVIAAIGYATVEPTKRVELVDIHLAPAPRPVEALPAERKQQPDEQLAQQQTSQDETTKDEPPLHGEGAIADAGIDAPPDAPADAARRRRPDAGVDAAIEEPLVADHDAGADDGVPIAGDGGDPSDGGVEIAGTGSGSGSGADPLGGAQGSGSSKPSVADEAAVEGAPTSAGTAANLLGYFPKGHRVTVMIRFDRLRGTDWLEPTERLFQPMPDYRRLFGGTYAKIGEKLEMLVISTPEPNSAIATTLVARTKLDRPALRAFLDPKGSVVWSTAKGGLVGKRGGATLFPGDKRVFISPFRGWFVLAHPLDLSNLLVPAPGNVDAIEASITLPAWLHGIRKIEEESGKEARGPALVLTMDLGGKRFSLGGNDFGLGVKSFPMPQRITVAAEVVKQGWLVQGNMRFATAADAAEFVKTALSVKQRIADSTALQFAVGKPISRVVANLSFATGAERVSYSTSVSISDMQAVMAVAAQLLDAHFANK